MLNVLSSGEQYNTNIIMMVRMCFVGITNFVSTHLVFVVIFCLLNVMVVLQAKQFLKLQLQWFFFLHFFLEVCEFG